MTRKILLALMVAPLVVACDDSSKDGQVMTTADESGTDSNEGMSDGSDTLPDTSDTADSANTTDTADGTDSADTADTSDTDDSVGFISEPDGGGVAVECDVWTDDCPEGEKCMPWANDGGNAWNATRCSPLDSNPGQIGDECTVEGSGVSGIDTCGPRMMCYYVDSETNTGSCVGFCDGTPNAPTCGSGSICTIVNDGVLTLCRPECDPLLQDCTGNAACLQATGSQGFTCIIDASGDSGLAGDPCEYINACDAGLYCGAAEGVPGCTGTTGCCSEFCDLTAMDPASSCSLGGGQDCVAWFEEGSAPPDLDHVGVCAIPQ
jgi:hypothetical protein